MPRFLAGIVLGVCISVLVVACGYLSPDAGSTSPQATVQPVALARSFARPTGGRLTVHQPVPHPAILAAGQLFVSLYVLIAQRRPPDMGAT